MNIGRFSIEQLSEGHFESFDDGKFKRLELDEVDVSPSIELPERFSRTVGIDPILVSGDECHILLDTGLGWGLDHGSRYGDVSNVKTNLDIFGLTPGDITHVVLTHLHYDHAAGSTYTDGASATRPTFPNARYYLQKREWEYAVDRVGKEKSLKGADYRLDDFYRLVADGRVELLDTDYFELLPGIRLLWTGGHTPGHQVVRVSGDGSSAYYLGDLVPSDRHLNRYGMGRLDLHPVQAKKMKLQIMKKMCEENACLLFYHSLYSKAGLLEKDKQKKKYVLREL